MELKELYDQIKNPLDDPKVINKLLDAYSKAYQGMGGFYGHLTKTTNKNNRGYNLDDSDKFYSTMFNKWKNSIVSLTKEQFTTLYRNGSFKQDLIKLREYLKTIPDVKTKEEANSILNGKYNDKELEDAFERYRWDSFGAFSGWVHVSSKYLTAKRDPIPNIEHRLYLNIESVDLYRVTNLLVKKFNERHIPYYFKFDPFANRDDSVVIYCSTELLTQCVEILQEIKRENKDIASRLNQPPILTGKIDNWIGYGSEPDRTPDGKLTSFNEVRSKSIESVIKREIAKWILEHKNLVVNYQGKNVTFMDYLTLKASKQLILKLQERLKIHFESDKKTAQREGKIFDPNEVYKRLGYTLQDIVSPTFRVNIYKILRPKMEEYVIGIYKDTIDHNDLIRMKARFNKTISYGVYSLENLFCDISVDIRKLDTNFKNTIYSAIKFDATKHGIYSEKYCFDIAAINKMVALYKANKIKNDSQSKVVQTDKEDYKKYLEQYKNRILNNTLTSTEPDSGNRKL